MKKLIINGDPGIRRDATIQYDGQEMVVFAIDRQSDWHGADEPQLWCTVGTEDERETFDKRQYVPHWLEVDTVDAAALDVTKAHGDLAV